MDEQPQLTPEQVKKYMASDMAEDMIYAITEDPRVADQKFEDLNQKLIQMSPAGSDMYAQFQKIIVDALEEKSLEQLRKDVKEYTAWHRAGDVYGHILTFSEKWSSDLLIHSLYEGHAENDKNIAEGDMNNIQGLYQIFRHIMEIKGDEANPLTKAIVKEVSALPADKSGSLSKLKAAFVKACKETPVPGTAGKRRFFHRRRRRHSKEP